MKINDTLKDNDPRMFNRRLRIVEIFTDNVVALDSMNRKRMIAIKRIHADGRKHKSGFDLEVT